MQISIIGPQLLSRAAPFMRWGSAFKTTPALFSMQLTITKLFFFLQPSKSPFTGGNCGHRKCACIAVQSRSVALSKMIAVIVPSFGNDYFH